MKVRIFLILLVAAMLIGALAGLIKTGDIEFKRPCSKIIPYEDGGLPIPFMTKLVDRDSDGTPDRVGYYAIGPGEIFLGAETKPTPEQIEWYKSH